MIYLTQVSSTDLINYAHKLYLTLRGRNETFESMAQALVQTLYDDIWADDGTPLFRLLRIFRFGPIEDLSPELRQQAKGQDRFWLTLTGTFGVENAWRSRHTSQGHRVIPADSYATPMLRAAFAQIGLRFGNQIQPSEQLALQQNPEVPAAGFFFVPMAVDSAYIPDQVFVRQYDIQSVLGIGAPFRDDRACFCIGFAHQTLTTADAEKWAGITPYIMTLLSSYDAPNKIWD